MGILLVIASVEIITKKVTGTININKQLDTDRKIHGDIYQTFSNPQFIMHITQKKTPFKNEVVTVIYDVPIILSQIGLPLL